MVCVFDCDLPTFSKSLYSVSVTMLMLLTCSGSLRARKHNSHLPGAVDRSSPPLATVAGNMSRQGMVQLRGSPMVCCEGQRPGKTLLSFDRSTP